ncbi:class A beta-lactamase [Legionella jamestowniensis]
MFICLPVFAASQYTKDKPLQEKLAELEVSAGGKIGVSAVNTANNQHLQYRAMERFPMGCTSKVVGVAAILKKSMSDPTLLQHKMHYKKEDLAAWSPITEKHVADGMTVSELCAAAITVSDNTAMNLLVKKLGGLQAINAYARSIGDKYFRVDNDWPKEAFSGGEGNLYDSSTPAAMEKSLTKLTLGDALARSQREQLLKWLKDNTTGETRIRAGVPKNWMVGDKTGTGASYGTTNDIAIIWPPGCAPLVVTIYFTKDKKDAVKQDEVVASATRLLLDEFSKTDSCIKQNVSKSV